MRTMEQESRLSVPPLVTVVVPCYNHADFLAETIDSVLRSTYTHIEIVIVDDGSSDGSLAIAKGLAEAHPNIRSLRQANGGPSVARNNGISHARGEYILPLDADDLIAPEYIAAAVTVLDGADDVSVVYCEAEKFEGKSGKWHLRPFSLPALARDNMIFVSAVFRKRDWLRTGGFCPDFRHGWEDWDFWISLLKGGGKVVKLPINGFYYRIRAGSRRKKMSKRQKAQTIALLNARHREFFEHMLRGPLRTQRSWSRQYNGILRFLGISES